MTTTNVTESETRAALIANSNVRWTGDMTYSIPGAGAVWASGYQRGEPLDTPQYGVLNDDQADNFRAVMETWDALIAPSMTEVSDSTPGQFRVAFTDVTAREPGAAAYAYFPPTVGFTPSPEAGDTWIDEGYKNTLFAPRTSDFVLLLHEVGHALGLKHPFEAPTVPGGYDSLTYTVMSYTSEDNTYKWYGTSNNLGVNIGRTVSFTPMVLDIRAIQLHYGADAGTAAGNTVHAFTNGDLDGRQTIYDASGADTLNLSALSRGSNVDLRPGAYSDLAYYNVEDQIRDLTEQYGQGQANFIRQQLTNPNLPAYEWERNLGLSFSTVIENVVGSGKADAIIGNDVANSINGGAGADTMTGLKGNDSYTVDNSADKVFEAAGGGTGDVVFASVSFALGAGQQVETLVTADKKAGTAINLNGNEFKNTISGNAGKNVLNGLGNNDTLIGLGGKDSFAFSTGLGAGNIDTISDFSVVDDTVLLFKSVFANLRLGELGANFFKEISASAQDANDRVLYNKVTGTLFYDADGAGGATAQHFATFTNKPANLAASDFIVV